MRSCKRASILRETVCTQPPISDLRSLRRSEVSFYCSLILHERGEIYLLPYLAPVRLYFLSQVFSANSEGKQSNICIKSWLLLCCFPHAGLESAEIDPSWLNSRRRRDDASSPAYRCETFMYISMCRHFQFVDAGREGEVQEGVRGGLGD